MSKLKRVNAGVPKILILGPFFSLIYVNGFPRGLHFNFKLLVDDSLLFPVIHDVDATALKLNNDLVKIQDWVDS